MGIKKKFNSSAILDTLRTPPDLRVYYVILSHSVSLARDLQVDWPYLVAIPRF